MDARDLKLELTTWRQFEKRSIGMLRIGETAPDFTKTDTAGKIVRLDEVARSGRLTVVTFVHPKGNASWQQVVDLQSSLDRLRAKGLRVIAVSEGADPSLRKIARENLIDLPIVTDEDGSIWKAFRAPATPFGVVLDSSRRVRYLSVKRRLVGAVNPLCLYAERQLLGTMTEPLYGDPSERIGKPLPAIRVRDTEGRIWTSALAKAGPRRFVFLNPECAACVQALKRMLRTPGEPLAIVVTSNNRETVRERTRQWTSGGDPAAEKRCWGWP
jgi:peroxiredoxin